MNKPKVSIVIVTWNSAADIADCLESVLKQDYENIEGVVVVDNVSSDNTVSIIKQKFPTIDLIQSNENTYFTGGHNIGIKHSLSMYKPEYVAILNPDTSVPENWLREMVDVASSDSKIGIVGPKIKFWKNENEGKINSAGMLYDGFMQGYDRGILEEDLGQFDITEDVVAVTGCSMLLKSEMLNEIGLFWERLKMYLEDLELCIRAKKKGWRIVYTGNTFVNHKWMQSTNKNKNLHIDKLKMKNWMWIGLRHYKLRSKLAVVKKYLFSLVS